MCICIYLIDIQSIYYRIESAILPTGFAGGGGAGSIYYRIESFLRFSQSHQHIMRVDLL